MISNYYPLETVPKHAAEVAAQCFAVKLQMSFPIHHPISSQGGTIWKAKTCFTCNFCKLKNSIDDRVLPEEYLRVAGEHEVHKREFFLAQELK